LYSGAYQNRHLAQVRFPYENWTKTLYSRSYSIRASLYERPTETGIAATTILLLVKHMHIHAHARIKRDIRIDKCVHVDYLTPLPLPPTYTCTHE
jgi:hypothetical protein